MIVLLLIIGGAFLLIYLWYASIITKKNKVKEALAGIDVQLTKRNDLIPNVLKIAKAFMNHEKELLQQITSLRTAAAAGYNPADPQAVKQHLQASDHLGGRVQQLMVAVENYPELKSDRAMVEAQHAYSEVEEHITASRRFYNAAVTELNNAVEIFPGSVIAKFAGVGPMPFYEAPAEVRAPVDASKYL